MTYGWSSFEGVGVAHLQKKAALGEEGKWK